MRATPAMRRGPVDRARRRPSGRLSSHPNWTDRRGLVTNYNYNPDSGVGSGSSYVLSSITPPSGSQLGTRTLTFDSLDRLKTYTTGGTTTTTNAYDGDDRVLTQDYSGTAGTDITNTYDNNGNLTSRVSGLFGGKITSYAYDWMNRLTQQTNPDGTVMNVSYDALGNLIQLKQTVGTQIRTTNYTYDAVNNLASLIEPGGNVDVFRYDSNNKRVDTWDKATVTSSNFSPSTNVLTTIPTVWALHINNQLDKAGRLTEIKTTRSSSDSTVVTDFAYCHSSLTTCPTASDSSDRGKIMWEKDKVTGRVTNYTYSHAGRLLTADNPAAAGIDYTYTYDADGNRTSAIPLSGTASYAAFDAGYGLCKLQTTSGPTCPTDSDSGSTSRNYGGVYGYDGSGNQTLSATATSLGYNGADMLISSGSSAGVNYAYAYAGANQVNRDSTNVRTYPDTVGTTTMYRNGVEGVQSTASSTSTSSPGYVLDPTGALIGTYADNGTAATTIDYFAFDGKASVVAIVSPSGTVDAQYRYDPWGTALTGRGLSTPPANSYAYKGQYLDASGLYKSGLRYYDPAQARWTQQDLLETLGAPNNANQYAAFGDDPIGNADPSGAGFWDGVKAIVTGQVVSTAGFAITGAAAGTCEAVTLGIGSPICGGILIVGGTASAAAAVAGWVQGISDWF